MHNYELLENDLTVVSGGIGKASLLSFLAETVQNNHYKKFMPDKIVNSIIIKIDINDPCTPCIILPILTKPTKEGSKEYKSAYSTVCSTLFQFERIVHTTPMPL